MRDRKKKGPPSYFDRLRNKIARRRERLSLAGRARRILGNHKFARGAQDARDKQRRKRK